MPESSTERQDRKTIALIGMMGVGKSTTGRLLARRLNRKFFDSDAFVEAHTGKTVRQIFETEGEAAFRQWEAEAVRIALTEREASVLGVAGGAVLREQTRKLLGEHATVVWLRAPIEVLIGRVSRRRTKRPLITEDPDGAMRNLYLQRRPIYESIANHIVDVEQLSPTQVVQRIIGLCEAAST